MLANELGRRGITVLLVDPKEGTTRNVQANATQARTMEHYRRLGFADEVREPQAAVVLGVRRRGARARHAGGLPDRHRLFHPLRPARASALLATLRARRTRARQDAVRLLERRRAAPSLQPEIHRAGAAPPRRAPRRGLGALWLAHDAVRGVRERSSGPGRARSGRSVAHGAGKLSRRRRRESLP